MVMAYYDASSCTSEILANKKTLGSTLCNFKNSEDYKEARVVIT